MGFIQLGEKNICPQCYGNSVRKSRRRGAMERILCALFLISPFRCEDCDHRYFRFRSANSTHANGPATHNS